MVDTADLDNRLMESHWEKLKDYPNREDFKEYRLTRHKDQGGGNFVYLAQETDESVDEIYQLTISDTKSADPFKGVQIVNLVIKDRKTIVAILTVEGDYFVRKNT